MPKIFQCLYCDKKILGGTYTLIKHVEKYHKNEWKIKIIKDSTKKM